MPKKFPRLAFVDVETTGGGHATSRITEIGIILVEKGKMVDEFYTLINPECEIPEFIVNITGITNRAVANAPLFKSISKDLKQFLNKTLFIAHNVIFDYKFIQSEFIRCGQDFNSPRLCTVKLSKNLFPELRKHNLDSIIEEHCIDCPNRHRALDDAKVLPKFYESARERTEVKEFYRIVEKLIDY